MTGRQLLPVFALVVATLAGLGAFIPALLGQNDRPATIRGVAPGYGPAAVDTIPNGDAVIARSWLPGLDAGFTPQGLAVVGEEAFISGYLSSELRADRGPCRVYRVTLATGAQTGSVDVPPPCGHAGGLAYAGGDQLYIADTKTLFILSLAPGFATHSEMRALRLGDGVVGGLAASGSDELWLGTYRENAPGRLLRFPTAAINRLPDDAVLTVADAVEGVPITSYAQGAAFDPGGHLWVAASDWRWGRLDERLNRDDGTTERHLDTAPGIEGIAFDRSGRLWAVSEAGARHVYDHPFVGLVAPFYPLLFGLDPDRMR